ncbi:L,D-transpeptidase [Candidatus Micrarchaeota archaeon]|nr:L,D-transpeptidase [Candidatus Micrarchaeota archaeon]
MNKISLIVAGAFLSASLCLSPNLNKKLDFPEPIIESTNKLQKEDPKVYPSKIRIEINLPGTVLRYFENDSLIMQTTTCIGAFSSYVKHSGTYQSFKTPIRQTEISRVKKDPWWTPNPKTSWSWGQKPVPPGPNNPLGPYILVIGDSPYYIHGTIKPHQLGQDMSHGCVRIHSDSVSILAPRVQELMELGKKVSCNLYYDISELYCISKQDQYYAVRIYPDGYRNRPNRIDSIIQDFENVGLILNEKSKEEIRKNLIWEGIMFFYYTEEGLVFQGSISDWKLSRKIEIPKEMFVYKK